MASSLPLAELVASFEQRWPLSHAEEWDAPGLITGNGSQRVSKVLLSVDVTAETAERRSAREGKEQTPVIA